MGYKFGKTSKRNLSTCHEDLQAVAELVLKRSRVDFTVTEGNRTIDRQQELYKAGKSKIDGINQER